MRALILPYLERMSPGQRIAIAYDHTKKFTARQSNDVAVALKNAGHSVSNGERKNGNLGSKIQAKHDIDLEHLSENLTFGEHQAREIRCQIDTVNLEEPQQREKAAEDIFELRIETLDLVSDYTPGKSRTYRSSKTMVILQNDK